MKTLLLSSDLAEITSALSSMPPLNLASTISSADLYAKGRLKQTTDNSNCLEAAVETDNLEMINLHLQLKAPPTDWKIQAAIIRSAELGRTLAARLLLDHASSGPGNIHWALNEGVFQAPLNNHDDMVFLLLDRGADINGCHTLALRPPRQNNPNFNPSSYVRVGPVDLAARTGKEERLRALLARGAKVTDVFAAIAGDQVGTLRILLSQGAETTWPWWSMLQTALGMRSKAVEGFLFQHDWFPDLGEAFEWKSERCTNIMRIVCQTGNVEAFERLVLAGMPVDKPLIHRDERDADWTPMLYVLASE